MECILKDKLIAEHKTMMEKQPMLAITTTCPLFNGRLICHWDCFHISDIAKPLTRAYASEHHPDYQTVVAEYLERDWDDIWSVCDKCIAART